MSLIPCPNQIGCDSDLPLTNFSSEDPDPKSFLGYSTGTAPTSSFTGGGGAGPQGGHGPDSNDTGSGVSSKSTGTGGDPPPLGSDYDNPTVTTFAESEESEDEANANAGNDNVSALGHDSKTGSPGGGYEIPPALNPPPIYSNTLQSCTVNCPDSGGFTFTVPAGAFRAFSLAQANAAARSYACRQANLNALCLGAISSTACFEQNYHQTIIASTPNIPVEFSVIAGALPDWITTTVSDQKVDLSGTPSLTDVGTSSFTIEAIDAFGFASSRSYTITVGGITTDSSLPTFAKNVPYSQQFASTDGGTYSIIAGALPTGLTLSDTGLLSGTPTVDYALFPFTAAITNASGRCSRVFSFGTTCVPAITPAVTVLVVDAGDAAFCNKTGTIFAVDGSGTLVHEISIAGVILHTFAVGADSIGTIFYENVHQRIYVAYKIGALSRIASYNPSTLALVNSTTLTAPATTAIPCRITYDSLRDKIWVTDSNYVWSLSATSFSQTVVDPSTITGGQFKANGGMVYCSLQDKVVITGQYFISPNPPVVGISAWNPATMLFTYTGGTDDEGTESICYNPNNGLVYGTNSPLQADLLIINPNNIAAFDTVNIAGSGVLVATVYNPCTNRVIAVLDGPTAIGYYINPITGLVVASVNSGLAFTASCATITYDSINSRSWIGTNANRLLKFT